MTKFFKQKLGLYFFFIFTLISCSQEQEQQSQTVNFSLNIEKLEAEESAFGSDKVRICYSLSSQIYDETGTKLLHVLNPPEK